MLCFLCSSRRRHTICAVVTGVQTCALPIYVATGFKSPAFNTSLVGPGGAAPADPEKNTNFEIGMKAETADHKLQGSIVAFYTDYRNNQTLTIPPGALTTVIYNLPKATITGIEAEFIARPFGGLSINGNVGLLWTKIDAPGVFVAGLPVDNQPLALTPKFTGTGVARYDFETSCL